MALAVVLVADAFAANSPVTGALRTSQLVGLGLALAAAAGLAITERHAISRRRAARRGVGAVSIPHILTPSGDAAV